MSVVNMQNFDTDVWIPPAWTANWKITITRLNGIVDDITSSIIAMRITDAVTDGIGTFEVEFPNAAEEYTGLYTGMETFTFYCDYAASSTTSRFKGKVEQASYQNNNVRLTGRRSDLFLADSFITATFLSVDAADILTSIVNLKGGGRFTTNGVVNPSGVTLTVTWNNKPFLECIKDLCTATGYDFYTDSLDDVQFYPANSFQNPDEAILHDQNIVDIGQFAPDISQVKNRVRVAGAEQNGVQIIYTSEDLNSQSIYGIKEVNIQDNNLIDTISAKQYGDYVLADGLNPPIVGDIKTIMLASIAPGDSIQVSSPSNGIIPSYQNIVKIVQEINKDGGFTTCTINKNPRQLSQVLRRRVESENQQQSSISNLFNLDFSYPFTFDQINGSTSNTTIDSGVLHLISAGTGTWISPILVLNKNLYAASIVVDAQTKTAITMQVSGNGGISYEDIREGNLLLVSSSIGTNLVFKLTLTDVGAQVKGVAVYYSVQ